VKYPIGVAKKSFHSQVNLDNGITNSKLGDFDYTMELFRNFDGSMFIEWDIPRLDRTTDIGLTFREQNILDGYDGVFELPSQAIELLRENGIIVSEEFIEE